VFRHPERLSATRPVGPVQGAARTASRQLQHDRRVQDDDGKYYMYIRRSLGGQLQHWKPGKQTAHDDSSAGGRQALALSRRTRDSTQHGRASPRSRRTVKTPRSTNGKPAAVEDHIAASSSVVDAPVQGNYYFSYSSGDYALHLDAMGMSPYGPFTYKGTS
jgi:hypothetical protein